MGSSSQSNLSPAPVNPNFDKVASAYRQHQLSLYKRRDDRTDFYNEFMMKPDIFCSKEHKKMKFLMAVQTGDYENIPKNSEKLWGWEMKDFKEEDMVRFSYNQFDKVKKEDGIKVVEYPLIDDLYCWKKIGPI